MYKNVKLQTKNACSSIFQMLVPVICVLIVLSLQQLARSLADNNGKMLPPDFPFQIATMLNIPYHKIPGYAKEVESKLGIKSCIKINKYGFASSMSKPDQSYITKDLFFDNSPHLRSEICTKAHKDLHIMSPYYNVTDVTTFDEMNANIMEDMKVVYESKLAYREDHPLPVDGFYLFKEANKNKIDVTIMSNNMNNQLYHRPNGQTQLWLENVPVS